MSLSEWGIKTNQGCSDPQMSPCLDRPIECKSPTLCKLRNRMAFDVGAHVHTLSRKEDKSHDVVVLIRPMRRRRICRNGKFAVKIMGCVSGPYS